jgi:hypothetical protein
MGARISSAGSHRGRARSTGPRQLIVRTARDGIEVKFPAAGWLLDRDEDADPGAVVPGVGQGGQASCGGPVQGGQGMGAGRPACCPQRSARWRPRSPLPAIVALP